MSMNAFPMSGIEICLFSSIPGCNFLTVQFYWLSRVFVVIVCGLDYVSTFLASLDGMQFMIRYPALYYKSLVFLIPYQPAVLSYALYQFLSSCS